MRPRIPAHLILAAAVCTAIFGCGDSEADEDAVAEAEVLYFEPIGYGRSGTLSDTTEIVLRTEEEWLSYRDSLNPVAPFADVDFTQSVVLLVALPQETSGHSIDFLSVEESDSNAVAHYVVSVPAEDCLTAIADAVPFQAVMVRRTDKPVQFTHELEEYRCTFGRRR